MHGLFFYVGVVLKFILSMIDNKFNINIKFYAISNIVLMQNFYQDLLQGICSKL